MHAAREQNRALSRLGRGTVARCDVTSHPAVTRLRHGHYLLGHSTNTRSRHCPLAPSNADPRKRCGKGRCWQLAKSSLGRVIVFPASAAACVRRHRHFVYLSFPCLMGWMGWRGVWVEGGWSSSFPLPPSLHLPSFSPLIKFLSNGL